MDLSKIKEKDILKASSKFKIAYKNLEEYDKGNYKVDEKLRLKELRSAKNVDANYLINDDKK